MSKSRITLKPTFNASSRTASCMATLRIYPNSDLFLILYTSFVGTVIFVISILSTQGALLINLLAGNRLLGGRHGVGARGWVTWTLVPSLENLFDTLPIAGQGDAQPSHRWPMPAGQRSRRAAVEQSSPRLDTGFAGCLQMCSDPLSAHSEFLTSGNWTVCSASLTAELNTNVFMGIGPFSLGNIVQDGPEETGYSPSLSFSQNPHLSFQDLSISESLYSLLAGIRETPNNT